MAKYTRYGTALSLFDVALGWGFAGHVLYHTDTTLGIAYADGSTAYFTGSGLQWSDELGHFTAGTITAINHYSNGSFNDSLEGLAISAVGIEQVFAQSTSTDQLRVFFLSGDDILDGRHRLGGVITAVKLIGFNGNDTIYGGKGADLLGGENGNDVISGGAGDDKIYGGSGHDSIHGGSGIDRVNAGSGDDVINGDGGDDYLHGAAGNDTYIGGTGIDTAIYARSFYDLVITVTAGGLSIVEPHGLDTLTSIERIAADEGVFVHDGSTGLWHRISSTPGDLLLNPGSALEGTAAGETLDLAGTGDNIARGFDGNDIILGTTDFDLLLGGNGNDLIKGDASAVIGNMDRLHGEAGNDRLLGLAGDDMLYGGPGNDVLAGGNDDDVLTGGPGGDIFVFNWRNSAMAPETWGHDEIVDFITGEDHLRLNMLALPAGTAVTAILTQTADGALITLAGAGTILLRGIDCTGYVLGDFLI